ncbi:TNF receptor-associated factor 1-like [Exaiptasia diaphana]|uniref:MATH domain-containing protein n=1 Tax=Exaiptasia diaphana TaxID=2652724 RepID=A0A913YCB2_EXADI|nr:TNF receptor-associated factor 1-like [Exaiptasia diaphana]
MTKDDQSHYSYRWKINNFSKQLKLAKQEDRDIKLYSESFYTHKYGYKLKLRLYPNGVGVGKGTHASVFMVIMRGEYDAILTWPFDWKYNFTLLDQKPEHSTRENFDGGYSSPDTSNHCYQRPKTNENVGIGRPKFVSHETLKTENYVVDGEVFIKFELEDPSLTPSLCDVMMSKDDQSHYSYTWKINDFSKQLQLAKQEGRNIRLYSELFYTHKYGYKLKLSLDANGECHVKGTHVSVFMIIMRGEYDTILTWPFNWKYKFTLLDQKPEHSMRKKHRRRLQYSRYNSS